MEDLGRDYWKHKRVIEVGSGISALNSLTAEAMGAERVLATDGDEAVVSLVESSFSQNFPESDKLENHRAQKLRFGDNVGHILADFGERVDVVLASDVTYRRNLWPKFTDTIRALSGDHPEVFYSFPDRNPGEWEALQRLFHLSNFDSQEVHLKPKGRTGGILTDDIRIMRLTPR
jgi:predicted nicotinamide N-methyase